MNKETLPNAAQIFWDEIKKTTLHACGRPRCLNNIEGDCRLKSIVIDENGKCFYYVE